MPNREENKQAKKDIVKILKDSFNNKDVSFYFIRLYSFDEKGLRFILPDSFQVKGKENILVASNLFYLMSELQTEIEWQIGKLEKNSIKCAIFDIGAAYPSRNDNKFQKFTNFSAAVAFESTFELASFFNEIYSEIKGFIKKQSKKDIKSEMNFAVRRSLDLFNDSLHEEIDLILSADDAVLRDKLAEAKSINKNKSEIEIEIEVDINLDKEKDDEEKEVEDFETDSEYIM